MKQPKPTVIGEHAGRLLVWAALVVLLAAALLMLAVALLGGPLLLHARPHNVTTEILTPAQEPRPTR